MVNIISHLLLVILSNQIEDFSFTMLEHKNLWLLLSPYQYDQN